MLFRAMLIRPILANKRMARPCRWARLLQQRVPVVSRRLVTAWMTYGNNQRLFRVSRTRRLSSVKCRRLRNHLGTVGMVNTEYTVRSLREQWQRLSPQRLRGIFIASNWTESRVLLPRDDMQAGP